MVDFAKLREKFPSKNKRKTGKAAAAKKIAREYARKRMELGISEPVMRRGFPYYMAVLMGMMLVGALVIPRLWKASPTLFSRQDKKIEIARKSLHNLAVALGRYHYHCKIYPTTEEGLAQLARKRNVAVEGWDGPYIRWLNQDPWQRDYVYMCDEEGVLPTLFSKGPDGVAGTTDDILAVPSDFEEAYRDTSWTVGWLPQHLRGYVVVLNDYHRAQIEKDLEYYLNPKVKVEGVKTLSEGWEFAEAAEGRPFDSPDLVWHPVRVPHTLLSWTGVGYYKRMLSVPKEATGKFMALRFNGALAHPRVYLNGEYVGGSDNACAPFEVDVSDLLRAGEPNELVVRVDTLTPSDSPCSDTGLVRPVNLAVENPEHRILDGTLNLAPLAVTEDLARMRAVYGTPAGVVTNDFEVAQPILWSPKRPFLHHVELEGQEKAYPIRSLSVSASGGCELNGEPFAVRGVDLPPENGPLGSLYHPLAARRLLTRLKDMGANAVRTGGRVPDPGFLDLCDEMGFLVCDTGFSSEDQWVSGADCFDRTGSPTDFYYHCRARWNEDALTIRLAPHWTWPGRLDEPIDVTCETNGDEVELFLNGVSQGRRQATAPGGRLAWSVPYEEGELKAIVYRRGLYLGEETVRTADRPFALRLTPEDNRLADGEIAFLTLEAVDDRGAVVPLATNDVALAVEGPGEVLAVGTTSSRAMKTEKPVASVTLERGRAVVIVRRNGRSGQPFALQATAPRLRPSQVKFLKRKL